MSRFNNIGIRTQVLMVSVALLVVVIVTAGLVYTEISRTHEERQHEVIDTFNVIATTDAMMLQLVNMQTGYRGFLVNGKQSLLEPYNAGYQAYTQHYNQLASFVQNNPSQIQRLSQIDQYVREWNDQIVRQGIQLREQFDKDQITELQLQDFAISATDVALFDKIRAEIDGFRQVQSELLRERNQEAMDAIDRPIRVLLGSTIVALLAGFGVAFTISGNIARRISRVAEAATQMAQGNMLVRCDVPSSRDEVGRMAVAFNTMAETIQQRTTDLEGKSSAIQAASERQQQLFETVQQLSTPLLPVMSGLVVLPIVGHIDTRRADDIMRTLLHGVSQQKAKVAILDVTGIATLDTHVIKLLLQAVQATQLLGAEVLLAGISAPMAQVIITQGIDLRHLRTYKDLRSAIEAVIMPPSQPGSAKVLALAGNV
jgi:methyl-accepting chemotaxis protein